MKYAILIGDGMADWPIDELNGMTPLQGANIPNMDYIGLHGVSGLVQTLPKGMKPGSDVAIMSILGYDPFVYYSGRGPLEAASMDIDLSDDKTAFRCNLVSLDKNIMKDYSAGHISTEESKILIEAVQSELGNNDIQFYPGKSYRHLTVMNKNIFGKDAGDNIETVPPHDILNKEINEYMPIDKDGVFLTDLMRKSKDILSKHPINQKRLENGQNTADMIWLWGQGGKPDMELFKDKYGLSGGLISAVDLLKGLGKSIGFDIIHVPDITGYYDTNYIGKGKYGVAYLDKADIVVVHVEAPDEAGHNGHLAEKIKAIENFDKYVVGEMLDGIQRYDEWKIMVLPDHRTPIEKRTHTSEPIPVAILGTGIVPDAVKCFSEKDAEKGDLSGMMGYDLVDKLIRR